MHVSLIMNIPFEFKDNIFSLLIDQIRNSSICFSDYSNYNTLPIKSSYILYLRSWLRSNLRSIRIVTNYNTIR